MGREVKRIALNFKWPLHKVWFGYQLEPVSCQYCNGVETDLPCPVCQGEGSIFPGQIEPPEGEGYQVWETTSEGSPITPVFANPVDLAHWCEDNHVSTFASMTMPYAKWLEWITSENPWAPSAMITGGRIISGIEGILTPPEE